MTSSNISEQGFMLRYDCTVGIHSSGSASLSIPFTSFDRRRLEKDDFLTAAAALLGPCTLLAPVALPPVLADAASLLPSAAHPAHPLHSPSLFLDSIVNKMRIFVLSTCPPPRPRERRASPPSWHTDRRSRPRSPARRAPRAAPRAWPPGRRPQTRSGSGLGP